MNITPEDTLLEIKNVNIIPDILIYLHASKDAVIQRLSKRDNSIFDEAFFDYENKIYEKICDMYDTILMVDNDDSIDN